MFPCSLPTGKPCTHMRPPDVFVCVGGGFGTKRDVIYDGNLQDLSPSLYPAGVSTASDTSCHPLDLKLGSPGNRVVVPAVHSLQSCQAELFHDPQPSDEWHKFFICSRHTFAPSSGFFSSLARPGRCCFQEKRWPQSTLVFLIFATFSTRQSAEVSSSLMLERLSLIRSSVRPGGILPPERLCARAGSFCESRSLNGR